MDIEKASGAQWVKVFKTLILLWWWIMSDFGCKDLYKYINRSALY